MRLPTDGLGQRPTIHLVEAPAAANSPSAVRVVVTDRGAESADRVIIERNQAECRLLVADCPPTAEQSRTWGRSVVEKASRVAKGSRLVLDLADLPVNRWQAVAEGLLDADVPLDVDLILGAAQDHDAAHASLARATAMQDAVRLTRHIVDARGNQCPPTVLAGIARRVAKDAGLGFRRRDEDELRREGMGGLLAIGAGSTEPALLVELWYRPDGEPGPGPAPGSVALVGKGVTFDSGGLSLKPPAAQVGMHTDKAGAATVLGVMSVLGRLGIDQPVHAVLPVVENLPGPTAVRPGDVVQTRNGLGVEIVDTDFEGRVIMADALAWAAEHEPRCVIDIATLTYQALIALGPEIGAAVARDAGLGQALLAAAEDAGEPLWGLPWAPRYASQIRSIAPGAHLKNHPGTDTARALTAALFLGEFVPPEIPWVHLDVAGPAVQGSGAAGRATGYGVRTLLEFLGR